MSHRPRNALQSVDLDTDASVSAQLDGNYDEGLEMFRARDVWSSKGPSDSTPRLGVQKTVYLHAKWAWCGLVDACKCQRALAAAFSSKQLLLGLLKGLLLSGVVSAIIYTFVSLLPHKKEEPAWPDMSGTAEQSSPDWFANPSHVFWLYPLIAGSYLIASTWSIGVAEAAFIVHNTQPQYAQSQDVWTIKYAVRTVLILNYTLICYALQSVPIVGAPLTFLVMCFIDGYFCFEQVWSVRGWPLEKRLRFAESHWSFLMGFGIPSTLVSFFHPSNMLNLMLFMLVFPLCTLLAFLAVPQPQSASLGAQTAMLPSTMSGSAQNMLLARCLPARIPLFWPTVLFRRWMLKKLGTAPSAPLPKVNAELGFTKRVPSSIPSMPRRSAASFVGGAWTPSPKGRMVSAPLPGTDPALHADSAPWHASAVSIPMSSDTLGSRRMPKHS